MRALLVVIVVIIAVVLAAIGATTSSALAQTAPPVQAPIGPQLTSPLPSALSRFAAAISYQVQRSNAPPAQCGCFTLQGLRAELSYRPAGLPVRVPAALDHLSGVFELGGGRAANIHGNGLDLSLVTYLAGPRYVTPIGHKLTPFAQVLFGGVHGFDTVFPRRHGVTDSATSFALAAGGGLDLELTKRVSMRLIQVDYLKTALPNQASNGQSNLRIGAGIVARLDRPAGPSGQLRSSWGRLKAFLLRPFRHITPEHTNP